MVESGDGCSFSGNDSFAGVHCARTLAAAVQVQEYLRAASSLAEEEQHQQLTPVHVALVMLEDAEGVGRQAVSECPGPPPPPPAPPRAEILHAPACLSCDHDRCQSHDLPCPADAGKASGDEAWKGLCRVLRRRLVRMPKIEPVPDEVRRAPGRWPQPWRGARMGGLGGRAQRPRPPE